MNFLKDTKIEKSQDEIKKKKVRLILKIVSVTVILAIIVVSAVLYVKYGKRIYQYVQNPEDFKFLLKRFNNYDKLAFVFIRAFQTVLKVIPAEPLEIGSGILYGAWGGLFLCILGTEIGSLVIIFISKFFGRKVVELFVPLERINSLTLFKDEKKVYLSMFFLYLIPGTPKDIMTYAFALTDMNIWKFLLITSIARLPSIITSTWCGTEITNKNYVFAIVIFAVTAFAGVAGSLVYKAITDRNKAETKAEPENED